MQSRSKEVATKPQFYSACIQSKWRTCANLTACSSLLEGQGGALSNLSVAGLVCKLGRHSDF